MLGRFKGNLYQVTSNSQLATKEGAAALHDFISFLQTQPPANPIMWDNGIAQAC